MRPVNFINSPFTLTRSLASTVATPKRAALLDGYESPEPGPGIHQPDACTCSAPESGPHPSKPVSFSSLRRNRDFGGNEMGTATAACAARDDHQYVFAITRSGWRLLPGLC